MFEHVLQKVEKSVSIPYPERACLIRELKFDMDSAFEELRREGYSKSDAVQQVLRNYQLDATDRQELEAVHRSLAQKIVDKIPSRYRIYVEDLARLSFLFFVTFYIVEEVLMIDFVLAGGLTTQVVVLMVALFGLSLQGYRAIRWFILKDHSEESLESNTSTPLYLAGITFLLGCLGTAIGYYVVFSKWATNVITDSQFRVGLYEPLSCAIVAAGLVAILVTVQMMIQSRLRSMGIPRQFV